MERNRIIGLIGILSCMALFFLGMFFKEGFNDVTVLFFPLILSAMAFFVGYLEGGTLQKGVKYVLILLGLLVFAFIFGKLIHFLNPDFLR